jgi:integrase
MVRARLLPYPLARLVAARVKKIDVIAYRDALRKKYKPSTVNTTMAFLHRIFSWAIDVEIIDCRNPANNVERMRVAPLEAFYTREQCGLLLAPGGDPKIATALYTGMRHGELCGLRWSDVRFDLGCIHIRRSFRSTPKNGKPRTIPLHSELAPILRAWQARCPETAEGLCFPVPCLASYRMGRNEDAVKVRPILVAAGCPGDYDHPWHAMRHTFATLLAESGASPDAISRMMGHSSGGNQITAGYTHVSIEFLSRELEKLRLQPGQPANVLRIADYRQTA